MGYFFILTFTFLNWCHFYILWPFCLNSTVPYRKLSLFFLWCWKQFSTITRFRAVDRSVRTIGNIVYHEQWQISSLQTSTYSLRSQAIWIHVLLSQIGQRLCLFWSIVQLNWTLFDSGMLLWNGYALVWLPYILHVKN